MATFPMIRILKPPQQIVVAFALTLATVMAIVYLANHRGGRPLREEPLHIVMAYVKASYARDYKQAYDQISSMDKQVMDERDYTSQYVSFTGFALELARKLAGDMDIWVVNQKVNSDLAHYTVEYKIPLSVEVSSVPDDWDQDKLNALSRAEQERFLERLARSKGDGKMITITGKETFDLVRDQGRWKIFFDWASRARIKFNVITPHAAGIDIRVHRNKFLAKQDEPFTTAFRIKNISNRPLVAQIVHHIEPPQMENHIDMIMCGALRPLMLQPGEDRELSSAYILRDGAGESAPLTITYEFKMEPTSSTPPPATNSQDRS